MMRNQLYPKHHARYVVGEELKELENNGTKMERDRQFWLERLTGSKVVEKQAQAAQTAQKQQEALDFEAFTVAMTEKILEDRVRQEEEARMKEEELERQQKREEDLERKAALVRFPFSS